jgi:membrane DNA delivery protein
MGDKALTGFIAILTAVIGVAIIAVLVSKQSNTAGVLTAGGSAFSSILKTAVSPVSGGLFGSSTGNTLSFPYLGG